MTTKRAAPPGKAPEDAQGRPVGRRVVLSLLGLGAVGIVGGARVQSVVGGAVAQLQSSDPTGLSELVPGGDGFRYYTVVADDPKVSAAQYRLSVSGYVSSPKTLTMSDLAALPQTSLVKDFQCVTGWRVPQVHWSGVRLSDLLDSVGTTAAATAVRFTSLDGTYTESLTMAQARRPDVLVATSMLGGPVSGNHGGPVRLYVAPMYGYKSLKWLGGIELVDKVEPGYWEQEGYDVDGWIGRSNGRDDAPV